MSNVQPSHDDFLQLFREEMDEQLHWQEAQERFGVLSLADGWRMPVSSVIERMEELCGKQKNSIFWMKFSSHGTYMRPSLGW